MLHHYGGRAPLTTKALISHHQRSRNGQMRARETRSRCVFRAARDRRSRGNAFRHTCDSPEMLPASVRSLGLLRYVSCVGGFRYLRRASSIRTT